MVHGLCALRACDAIRHINTCWMEAQATRSQGLHLPRMICMKASNPATQATWYFDVISPFSYLALRDIEELAQRISVIYRPILFAALLEHWKHLGPAEIPPKRIHTYRLVLFEAQRRGIPFRFPPSHPFNPLKLLRLLAALDAESRAVRIVMDRIWREGLDLSLKENWDATCAALGLDPDRAVESINASETKAKLRANTDAAVAA